MAFPWSSFYFPPALDRDRELAAVKGIQQVGFFINGTWPLAGERPGGKVRSRFARLHVPPERPDGPLAVDA
jgi:hypothetical protein